MTMTKQQARSEAQAIVTKMFAIDGEPKNVADGIRKLIEDSLLSTYQRGREDMKREAEEAVANVRTFKDYTPFGYVVSLCITAIRSLQPNKE